MLRGCQLYCQTHCGDHLAIRNEVQDFCNLCNFFKSEVVDFLTGSLPLSQPAVQRKAWNVKKSQKVSWKIIHGCGPGAGKIKCQIIQIARRQNKLNSFNALMTDTDQHHISIGCNRFKCYHANKSIPAYDLWLRNQSAGRCKDRSTVETIHTWVDNMRRNAFHCVHAELKLHTQTWAFSTVRAWPCSSTFDTESEINFVSCKHE